MNSGLLLGVLTLLGVLVGGGVQFVLSLLAHRQAARDDRRARTRGYVAKVYGAAYMFLIYSQTAAIQPPAMSGTPSQVLAPDPLSWVDLRKTGAGTQEAIAMRALEGGNDEVIDAYLNVKTAFAK